MFGIKDIGQRQNIIYINGTYCILHKCMTCMVTKLLYFTIPSGGRWESYIIFEILVISVKP